MSDRPPAADDLLDLVHALCEELLTAEQAARLEARVLADPAAEAFVVRMAAQHAELHRHHRRAAAAPGAPPPPRRRWPLWLPAVALAAGLAAAVWLTARGPSPAHAVAAVAATADAVWAGQGEPGPRLPAGPVDLASGSARLDFASGATLVVEGPAELHLLGPDRVRCVRGRVWVGVPEGPAAFSVDAPALRAAARGAAFGVSVTPDGVTEAHALAGRLAVEGGGGPVATDLDAGHALRHAAAGPAARVAADPGLFLTPEHLARLATATPADRAAARDRLAAEPGLRVYFPFDRPPAGGGGVPNRAAAFAGRGDGVITGAAWAEGGRPGEGAVEFRGPGDRVAFSIDEPLESLGLAARVRADALPNYLNGLLMSDGWSVGGVHWQVHESRLTRLCLAQPGPYDEVFHWNFYPPHELPGGGRWAHLAATYDRAAGRASFYVDGQPMHRAAAKLPAPFRVGPARLGDWDPKGRPDRTPVRNLVGRMSEFALFARPLTDAEVLRLSRGEW